MRACLPLVVVLCGLLGPASALVVPARALMPEVTPASASRTVLSLRTARVAMQVDAPVRPKVDVPQLAPTKPSSDKDNEKAKKYKVLLFNDNVNRCAASAPGWPPRRCTLPLVKRRVFVALRRREYVARILVGAIPGMSQADAYLVMQKAHKQGMAVVGVWVFEVAEAYCDKLKSGGLIASVTEED
jgi:ATP-dependent Clp protease adaptor protein ClpS